MLDCWHSAEINLEFKRRLTTWQSLRPGMWNFQKMKEVNTVQTSSPPKRIWLENKVTKFILVASFLTSQVFWLL